VTAAPGCGGHKRLRCHSWPLEECFAEIHSAAHGRPPHKRIQAGIRPMGMDERRTDGGFSISIAGGQEKTAPLSIGGSWFQPHGSTVAMRARQVAAIVAIAWRLFGLQLCGAAPVGYGGKRSWPAQHNGRSMAARPGKTKACG
jgi:hypothetical protein